MIKTTLKEFGLNENQIKIYITLLQLGEATIQDLTKKTKIKRTTVYSILDNLIDKKLVFVTHEKSHTNYYAENPTNISEILNESEKKLIKKNKRLKQIIPDLKSIYNIHPTKAKIQFFEGIDGIKKVFNETLSLKKGCETLAYGSGEETSKALSDWLEIYMQKRTEAGISQRAIVENSKFTKILQKRDKEHLREMILVNKKDFPFKDQVNIFGNKIFIASFKNLNAILIESRNEAETQKAIFELAWISAKKIGIQSPNKKYPKRQQ